MEHKAELAKLERSISRHFKKAKNVAEQCTFWNDAGILDSLTSNEKVLGHQSPLRDNAVFPKLPPDLFRQMSRQALFAAMVLLARYGEKERFTSWLEKSQISIKISDLPTYRIDLSRLRNPCDVWLSIMRAYLSIANHRLLVKDKIYGDLFEDEGDTRVFGGILVQRVTAQSVDRYEELKKIHPFPYRFESPSQGPIHSLCSYYSDAAQNQNAKHELAKILSFGYSLYLLSRIHRSQKPKQTVTFLSPNAIFNNLFHITIGLPGPTAEEQLLDTDTDQPLYPRAYESVCKLLGLISLRPSTGIEKEIWGLFKRFVFNPMIYQEPLVAVPLNCVILQPTEDGCVFFDDVGKLIPSLVADYLLQSGKLQNFKGEAFRSYIEGVVRSRGLKPFRVSKIKREGTVIGDVDVGFVKDGSLCLVECKDVSPYPAFLLDREHEVLRSITHSDKGYMGWVNRTMKLQQYFSEPENLKKLAKEKNFDPTEVEKVVSFIVSNRPIFTYLTPDMFLTSSIPRVMIIDELEILLSEQWLDILPQSTISMGYV